MTTAGVEYLNTVADEVADEFIGTLAGPDKTQLLMMGIAKVVLRIMALLAVLVLVIARPATIPAVLIVAFGLAAYARMKTEKVSS